MINPLEEYSATKASDRCPLPLVYTEPAGDYRKIAMVEAFGEIGQDQEAIDAARHRACETGADALLVITSASQAQRTEVNAGAVPGNEKSMESSGTTAARNLYKAELGVAAHPDPNRGGYWFESYAIVYGHTHGSTPIEPVQ